MSLVSPSRAQPKVYFPVQLPCRSVMPPSRNFEGSCSNPTVLFSVWSIPLLPAVYAYLTPCLSPRLF